MATISTAEVKAVATLPKTDGRSLLLKCLKWEPFDEDNNMRQAIHLDFLYDNLQFAAEKGFAWGKVVHIITFAEMIINKIKDCHTITDILGFYQQKSLNLCEVLGERDFKIYSSFIFETILPHFKLFKLVFTVERSEQIPNVPVKVEPPFESHTLKDTKPIKIWTYEKQIQELEENENERKSQRLTEQKEKILHLEQEKQNVLRKSTEIDNKLDKDAVSNIIQEVMKQFTLAATEKLKFDMEQLQDDLEFKLEKTVLPRPQALGPPPRYSVQTPKSSVSGKESKSPKPGSRASARSKKK